MFKPLLDFLKRFTGTDKEDVLAQQALERFEQAQKEQETKSKEFHEKRARGARRTKHRLSL